jgi:sterol desaturase/sphingolipid hydroxylase (fatty acid hydroxylase superfamily)
MFTVIVFTVLILLMAVENYFTYRDEHPQEILLRSYATNLGLMVFGDTVMSLLSVSSLMIIAAGYSGFGVLGGVSGMRQALVSLVLFDLMLYFWHRERHRHLFLWKFHQTHHSDLVMNTTTAFRLHFVEIFFTTLVKAMFVIVVGVNGELVLLNEMIVVLCAMFHHTNITFRGEQWASCFMVVPYSHRTHHSMEKGEYHRNFGAIFSIWDRVFGTLLKTEPDAVGLKHLGEQGFLDVLFLRLKKK